MLLWGHLPPQPFWPILQTQAPGNVSHRVRWEAFCSAPTEVVKTKGIRTGPRPPHHIGGATEVKTVQGQTHNDTV